MLPQFNTLLPTSLRDFACTLLQYISIYTLLFGEHASEQLLRLQPALYNGSRLLKPPSLQLPLVFFGFKRCFRGRVEVKECSYVAPLLSPHHSRVKTYSMQYPSPPTPNTAHLAAEESQQRMQLYLARLSPGYIPSCVSRSGQALLPQIEKSVDHA